MGKNPFLGKLKHEQVRTSDIQLQGSFDRRDASRPWLAVCMTLSKQEVNVYNGKAPVSTKR